MEARNRTLPDWLTRLRTHQLVLPRFQRHEAWGHSQITSLLDTILQKLPCGALLTLDVAGDEPFISRPISGTPVVGERVVEHLLDGQQRLTALWRSLKDDYDKRTFLVQIGPDEETGEPFFVISQARWEKNGNRYPLWVENPIELWDRRLIPIHLLSPIYDKDQELRDWAREASQGNNDTAFDILQILNNLRSIFSTYNIPFLSLPSSTEREKALDVFIRMNTSATALSDYDIVVAQVEAATDLSLHELVELLDDVSPNLRHYGNAADIALAASALLQDSTPVKSTYLNPNFAKKMIANWEALEKGVERAVKFLEQEYIFDSKRLPTDVLLHTLTALWAKIDDGLDGEGEARTILRKYLWRSIFTERYDRTSATRALVDHREILKLIRGDEVTPLIFDPELYPLPNKEILANSNWPVRKDRGARGLLALSLRNGGLDFADACPATRESLADREYHHLFPRGWLRVKNFAESDIDNALNCALVTWKTNRAVAAKSPSDYIRERMVASSLGENEIRHRIESHAIPFDDLMSDNYEKFRESRLDRLYSMMLRVCDGHRI